jgi:7-carboxy-7-deazaguanine synthase
VLNQQLPEKRVHTSSGLLQVHSIFATLQGEGPFCGTPAVFIRLAGCNLQCPGCDTDYTSVRLPYTINELVYAVQLTRSTAEPGLVVITGGEPFRQPIGRLIAALLESKFYVQIETNGTLPVARDIEYSQRTDHRHGAYIVCSPKTGNVHPSIRANACAVKYVMHANSVDQDDGLPLRALDHTAHPKLARIHGVPIYLQPMDSQDQVINNLNRAVCVASCLKHGYILQLQVHKLLGME